VDTSGAVDGSTAYDAWGNPWNSAGGLTSLTPFGFAGGYTDASGLVYLLHRYYDPSTGQFLSVDPLVDVTGQPYAYAGGDPVNRSDPRGTDWVSDEDGGGLNPGTQGAPVLSGGGAIDSGGGAGDANGANLTPYDWQPGPDGKLWSFNSETGSWESMAGPSASTPEYLGEGCAFAAEEGGAAGRTIVIGEDMEGRVIPTAQKLGADWYQPADAPPEQWMENNRRWINDRMEEGCTIIDCGPAPGRANFPDATSPYYQMELNEIAARDYALYQRINIEGEP
jgi:RHS repeat-associated protein